MTGWDTVFIFLFLLYIRWELGRQIGATARLVTRILAKLEPDNIMWRE